MILHYFAKKENTEKKFAELVYLEILKNSNKFINEYKFTSNKDYNTSYEIVSIYIILYINYNINSNVNNYKKINQLIVESFISDLDESLRASGIGDMSIGKYVKKYVKKFYYRLKKIPKNIDNIEIDILSEYLSDLKFIKQDQILDAANILLKYHKELTKL